MSATNTNANTQANQKPKAKSLADLELALKNALAKADEGNYSNKADIDALALAKKEVNDFHTNKQINIKSIKETISSYGFVLTDIYSAKELKSAGYIPETTNSESNGAGSGEPANTQAYAYPSDKNEVILLKPSTGQVGSREWSLKEGRIYEPLKGKGKKPFGQAIPKALTDAKTEQGILALATEYGKQYFATEKGKKELAEIVKVAQPKAK